ncbi:Zinc finger protein, partial [Tetrabaena socialis]
TPPSPRPPSTTRTKFHNRIPAAGVPDGCERPAVEGENPVRLDGMAGSDFAYWAYVLGNANVVNCWHCGHYKASHPTITRTAWDRSAFTCHEKSQDHKTAVRKYQDYLAHQQANKDMGLTEMSDEALYVCFATSYMILYFAMPFTHYTFVCKLHQHLKLANTTTLYNDPRALGRFAACIVDQYESAQAAHMQKATFIGIQMDEATCIAHESHAAICVTYDDPQTGELYDEFFILVKLTGWTGREMFEACLAAFEARGINLRDKLASFSGDGASAVASEKKGVFGYFRRVVNRLCYGVHCASHRVALAVKDAGTHRTCSRSLRMVVNMLDQSIRGSHAIFSKSSKRIEQFKALAATVLAMVKTPKLYVAS